MAVAWRRPVDFESTVRACGRVSYAVDKVGTFTVGYAGVWYPQHSEKSLVYVFFGLVDDERSSWWSPREVGPVPVVNGVALGGFVGVNPVTAAEFVAPDSEADPVAHRSSYWCRAHRAEGSEAVPDRTRDRVAFIVGTLVGDFLAREDAQDLLLAHLVAQAPERIKTHERNLEDARAELQEWQRRLEHEEAMLAAQRALLAGGTPETVEPLDLPRRDYRRAATREGERFLVATGANARRAS